MRVTRDPECENRIEMNALVDTYSSEEALSGWYSYLEDELEFPFSIIAQGEKILITVLAEIEKFDGDFYVYGKAKKGNFAIGLSEVQLVEASMQTEQVIKDWLYFTKIGDNYSLLEENEYDL